VDYSQFLVNDGDFTFMRPTDPISCRAMATCSNAKICKQAHLESRRILSIPQSAQSAPSSVYSQSVFSNSREFEDSADFFKADWPLVGHGVAHASCGTFWTKVCLEKHEPMELPPGVVHQKELNGLCSKNGAYIQRVKMSCHRPICPECWPDWRKRQVAKVKKRFEVSEEDYNRQEKRHVKRCHGAISVPRELWHLAQDKMKKLALKYLKQVGIAGGTIIYHPKRERKKRKGVWYYSPHFHVYFHAWNAWIDGEKVTQLHKKKGWIIRNFGERPLAKSISYQLSHAGVPPNHGHVVTWFGTMNYRLLHVEQIHGEGAKCPWGHLLTNYGVYLGKEKLELPNKEGYSAYLPKEGWLLLPKKGAGSPWDPGRFEE
jgi:hypothetical protein